jgi:hypothetical protein
MPDTDLAGKSLQGIRIKYLSDKPLGLVLVQGGAVKGGNPRTLLPPVLECIQGIIEGE